METQGHRDPGIHIVYVRLLKAHVEMANVDGKREYNPLLTGFRRVE